MQEGIRLNCLHSALSLDYHVPNVLQETVLSIGCNALNNIFSTDLAERVPTKHFFPFCAWAAMYHYYSS